MNDHLESATCSACEKLGGCPCKASCGVYEGEFSYYEQARPFVRWAVVVITALVLAALGVANLI